MSEYINNRNKRKDPLKGVIRHLHEGKAGTWAPSR
jgi:hypothetical protein